MNFIERFAPLARFQATMLEIDSNTFVILPEGVEEWSIKSDHVVVWYESDVGDPKRAQIGQDEYLSYSQVVTALLPVEVPEGGTVPDDFMTVLESAPDDVLAQFAAWAGDYNPDRYPSVREAWGWLNSQFGELRP